MVWIRRLALAAAALLVIAAAVAAAAAWFFTYDRAPIPESETVLNAARLPLPGAFDIMGRVVSSVEAQQLGATEEGRAGLAPANGAVRIDPDLVATGRALFYGETFGNEAFLSDVVGILDGGLSAVRFAAALSALDGRGTTNLAVRIARDVAVGDRVFRAGDLVSTGLDVPRGEFLPLGTRVFYARGQVRVGFTCALCHASVDRDSGKVVEGAPNTDLDLGLLLALSANPAAFFAQTGIGTLEPYAGRPDNIVRSSKGPSVVLPSPERLAAEVRAQLGAWPPGSFDTTRDGANNPTSIPSSFAAQSHPYGWSGQAALGPFRGLASVAGDHHGFSIDPTAYAGAAPTLLGLDPEVYLAILLQSAPRSELRFDPREGRKPSEIMAELDPTPGVPGLTRHASFPASPRPNYVTAAGLVPVRPGRPVHEALNALAAFQLVLQPPTVTPPRSDLVARGREVFDRAGCLACHSGPALTSHRVWPAAVIGSEPSRAAAFARLESETARPQLFAGDVPAPPVPGARLIDVPIPDEGQLKLGWAFNRTGGGYKVPGLVGLSRTAPYLHDGGVAVGPDPERRPGIDATLMAGIAPDPANSLKALIDRERRAAVTAANRASARARLARVTGEGHAFWVDREAGFTPQDQDSLVAYLLGLDRLQPPPGPPAR